MKKIITIGLALVTMLTFLGCPTPDNPSSGKSDPNQSSSNKDTSATPTIFLAGDSTVKTYADGQWIAGWGQYLGNFLNSSVKVRNCAQGGRSTRSFINEGRLFDTKETGYRI